MSETTKKDVEKRWELDPAALLMRINRLEAEIDGLSNMVRTHTKYINQLLASMPRNI